MVGVAVLAAAACSDDPRFVETEASSSTSTSAPHAQPPPTSTSLEPAGILVWSRVPYEPDELRESMLALFQGPVTFEEPACLVMRLVDGTRAALFMPPGTTYHDGVATIGGIDRPLGFWEVGGGLVGVSHTRDVAVAERDEMCPVDGQVIIVGTSPDPLPGSG